MDTQIQNKKIIFCVMMLFLFSFFAFAEDDRHLAVDQTIGGMEQGSRIGAPGSTPVPITDAHKTISSSQGTKKAQTNSATPAAGENHGNIYSSPAQAKNPVNTVPVESESTAGQTETGGGQTGGSAEVGTGETGSGQTTNPIDAGVSQPETEPVTNPINSGAGTQSEDTSGSPSAGTETDETAAEPTPAPDTGSEPTTETGSTDTQENNPIVDTEVSADLESGTIEADATVDTTGELEEKEIFEADLEAEGVGSVDTDVSSAADITGEEVVENADVTTDAIPETGLPDGQAGPTETSSSTESTQESNPIVDTEVSADLESGTIEADATVDTSGELEEKQIIDADIGVGETAAGTEVGSAADVTQSDIVEGADVTTQPVSSVTTTSDVTAEVDTTGETTGSEADVGLEADVSGLSEGEDVTCDPADGITADACGVPQL